MEAFLGVGIGRGVGFDVGGCVGGGIGRGVCFKWETKWALGMVLVMEWHRPSDGDLESPAMIVATTPLTDLCLVTLQMLTPLVWSEQVLRSTNVPGRRLTLRALLTWGSTLSHGKAFVAGAAAILLCYLPKTNKR